MSKKTAFYLERSMAIFVAVILLQTLFFKFTGAKESVEIFTKLGVEPWGRYFTGTLELIAGLMLLYPKTAIKGAVVTIAVMIGAVLSHIFALGTSGDQGQLFWMAVAVLALSNLIIKARVYLNK